MSGKYEKQRNCIICTIMLFIFLVMVMRLTFEKYRVWNYNDIVQKKGKVEEYETK